MISKFQLYEHSNHALEVVNKINMQKMSRKRNVQK